VHKATALVLGLAAALALSGCGTGGLGNVSAGNEQTGGQLFQSKCGGCHALAAAGTTANIGPDLDAAFGPDREQGFSESTIRGVVLIQMQQPSPPMPDDSVLFPLCADGKANQPQGCVDNRREALYDVAAYVAGTAGINGAEPPRPNAKSTDGKTIFTGNCGSCHTLKTAGTTGTIGPNLDQVKPPFDRAKRQVINGGGAMPAFKGRLTDQQIDAVAKFVADNAGK
jgi:mono/diheme cytochrome c family protein